MEDYIPLKKIWMYLIGSLVSIVVDLFVFASFPLISSSFISGVPIIHQVNRRRKYKKIIKEINELSNIVIIPLVRKLDEVNKLEREEYLKKEQERREKRDNIFIEALKEPMPKRIKKILDKRPDKILGTDKIRTFASDVPGLYSEESDLKKIIARRDKAFCTRNEQGKIRVKKHN